MTVEFSSESWFDRIKDSFRSVLAGLALFVVAFPILFWNEGRAITTARSLEEGAGAVVSVSADKIDAANEGKLVHFSGTTVPDGNLTDPDFGISMPALHIFRTVEMYQWVEKKKEEKEKKVGGKVETKTTYTYEKTWSSDVEDSKDFKEKKGHVNPGAFPVEELELHAQKVTVGAFNIPQNLINRMTFSDELPADESMLAKVSPSLKGRLKVAEKRFYLGTNPASPEIGDVRISFRIVKPDVVSIVSQQMGSTLTPYQTKAGGTVELLERGAKPAAAMFQAAQDANTMMTWILRFMGFLFMAIGLYMCFRPVAVLGDVIPFIGSMIAFSAGVAASVIAFSLSFVTIAVSWFFFRPVLSIVLLLVGVGAFVALKKFAPKKESAGNKPPPKDKGDDAGSSLSY